MFQLSSVSFALRFGILTLALALSACQTYRPSGRNASASGGGETANDKEPWDDLEVQPLEEFPDVPVPARFHLVPKESFTATSDTYRVAHLKYVGSATVPEVVKFYREHLPSSGWKLEFIMGLDVKTLDFSKEGDKSRCRVLVGPSAIRKTQVVIDIR
ncbi:MAG: hypothetical protein HYU36_24610 [Planctomycetes bacterium]|nr:hypothetical protein [Planctomycetota bacterium]